MIIILYYISINIVILTFKVHLGYDIPQNFFKHVFLILAMRIILFF